MTAVKRRHGRYSSCSLTIAIAYLSTLSALAGSVVGGLTSGVATWLGQRSQARESQLAREMARRDDLYKEFIAAASEGIRRSHCEQRAERSGIRCPLRHDQQDAAAVPKTVACAEKIMRATIDTYFAPGKTIREFHELVRSDPESICSRTSAKSRARSCGHSQRCNAVPGRTFHVARSRTRRSSTRGMLRGLFGRNDLMAAHSKSVISCRMIRGPGWALESRPNRYLQPVRRGNRHFRDYSLTGHDADMPKSTQMDPERKAAVHSHLLAGVIYSLCSSLQKEIIP
jgi:hypothetical protein